jgi:hypothetical protein
LRIDHHPFPVVNVFAHQAGGSQGRFAQGDAAAGFDRVEVQLGKDGHGFRRVMAGRGYVRPGKYSCNKYFSSSERDIENLAHFGARKSSG